MRSARIHRQLLIAAMLVANAGSALQRPVTSVTWSAARAYCAAEGTRLPTTAEWEYVAAADERHRDATRSMKHEAASHTHMLFCASAAIGASNPSDDAAFMRYAFRAGLTRTSAHQMLGFRCAV